MKSPFRVNRAELLSRLETVAPGLSPSGIIDQSSRFVFRKGRVITFNDEVACKASSGLPKAFTGAVEALPLLSVLRKMKEKEIGISNNSEELLLHGKGRREAGIRMDTEITLPIQTMERPEEWRDLPEDFSTALAIVHESAGSDQSKFVSTCVHIHPKWVEAADGIQMTRYRLRTGITRSTLVKRDSLKPIMSMDMTEIAETESWLHFRNFSGLVYSCRFYLETYPSITENFKVTGSPAKLPKGIIDDADIAEVFSKENTDSNYLLVDLRPGELLLKSVGNSGWYQVPKKIKYNGKRLIFGIGPTLLMEITKKYNDCQIGNGCLKVDGGRWTYVTTLAEPVTKKKKEEKGDDSPEDEFLDDSVE